MDAAPAVILIYYRFSFLPDFVFVPDEIAFRFCLLLPLVFFCKCRLLPLTVLPALG